MNHTHRTARPSHHRSRAPWIVPLLCLVVAVAAGCAVPPAAAAHDPVDRAAEEQALRELWSAFERAFNANDAAAAASHYAADSDRISASGQRYGGRAQIEQQYAALLAARAADPSSVPLRPEITVRFLRPDVALLDGAWTGRRSGQEVRGHFTLVATKEQGRWCIAAGRDRGVVP